MSKKTLKWDGELYQHHSKLQYELGLMTIERLNPKPQESILEIGSGNGLLTIEIAKKIPDGKVTAIEISKEMVEQARKNKISQNINKIEIINIDAIEIQFENEFDAVFSNSAIHWIPEIEEMYKLIYRSLKPNGRIAIQTGLKERTPMFGVIARLFSIDKYKKFFRDFKFPWKFLRLKENMKILEDAKFSNVSIETYISDYKFESKDDLFGYLKAASMVPFLTLLPEEIKSDFERDFLEIYLEENNNELCYKTTRIFITAEKKV